MKKYLLTLIFIFAANQALACACSNGISNVGTSSIIPNGEGGTIFTQYDYIAQTRNWHQNKKSDKHNHDQRIETQTITLGGQYMFNRDFGVQARLPYVNRKVISMDHGPEDHHGHHSMIDTYNRNTNIGDIRISGIYSGLFDDMSTGFTFGLKLPTGQTNAQGFGRNMQLGSGSYDAILGFYHKKPFGQTNGGYFVQATFEKPFSYHQGYKPGEELSSSIGTYYSFNSFGTVKSITPIMQVTSALRANDRGWADPSHNGNSGYKFFYFNPGLEIALDQYKLYFDVGLPLYRSVKGNQLAPQNTYKVILGYNF